MLRALLKALQILIIVHAVAALSLLVYGGVSGRFRGDLRSQYLATWRGEKLVPPPPEVVVEETQDSPMDAGERIARAEIEQEMMTRELQRQIDLLRDLSVTVNAAQEQLRKERRELEAERAEFAAMVERQRREAEDEGFRIALANYERMNPRAVKDDFMMMDDDQAVRYLRAMRPQTAAAILEQFRTAEEQARRVRYMALLEAGEMVGREKTTAGAGAGS